MSDIDFDELDKAVNTIMKGADTSSPATPSVSTVPQANTNSETTLADQRDDSVSVDVKTASPKESPTASPAFTPRRRGQFMDFVPRAATPTAPAVRRQGPTLQPSTSAFNQEPETKPEDTSAVALTPAETSPAVLVETEPATTEESSVIESASEKLSEPTPIESVKDRETPGETEEYSPFLSDAKVDKRPLGEPVSVNLETLEKELSAESAMTNDAPAQPESPAPASLPVELHPDVARLESDTTEGTDEPSLPGVTPTPSTAPAGDETSSSVQNPDPSDAPVATPTPAPAASVSPAEKRASAAQAVDKPSQPITVMGSIPQQYTEQPSSGDQTTGSIYDTEQYHQPLQHPEKKKSSVAMIIWIIIFGLLGVAAAAGYFFLTMRP